MELHSYAKRRTTPKKWSNEQRRILIDARIAYESLFAQTPRGSVQPWKKILTLAKLDDYNVFFVRKQWSNMVAKYKQYKINRFGHINTINEEMIAEISKEWEFFGPIHDYMTLKTRKLHSYALQYHEEPSLELYSNSNSTQSSTECINIYSSDTNDIPISLPKECLTSQNTDHDSYSKKWVEQQQIKQNLIAKASENVQEPAAKMDTKEDAVFETHSQTQFAAENEVVIVNTQPNPQQQQQQQTVIVPMEVQTPETAKTNIDNKTPNHLSERDRYYRHKRRFNRRFERRFDAMLQVVGQVVKAEYPSIDVSPLMQVANAAVELGSQINGQIFSSGDEFDDESDEGGMQKNKTDKPTTSTHDTSQRRSFATP